MNSNPEVVIFFVLGIFVGMLFSQVWKILTRPATQDGVDEAPPGNHRYRYDNTKMVFAVRTDLKMGKGKIAAQCGHACLGVYESAKRRDSDYWQRSMSDWQESGTKKICLKVKTEDELVEIYKNAK